MTLTEKDLSRFRRKVNQKEGECHEWRSGLNEAGYGLFWLLDRNQLAHRVAWTIANGPIPEGAMVLHSCNNPRCVNPLHLRTGTHQDNMEDKVKAGRCAKANAKLSLEQLKEIRELVEKGESTKKIAALYGISRRHVYRI